MRHKFPLFLTFFLIFLNFAHVSNLPSPQSSQRESGISYFNKSTSNDLLANFTNIGDFIPWSDLLAAPDAWTLLDDEGAVLKLRKVRNATQAWEQTNKCAAIREFDAIDTSIILRTYNLTFMIEQIQTPLYFSGNYYKTEYWIFINFTDSTAQNIYYFEKHWSEGNGSFNHTASINGSIESNKFVECIQITFKQYLKAAGIFNNTFYLESEAYFGRKARPASAPLVTPPEFKIYDEVQFSLSTDITPTSTTQLILYISYQDTGNTIGIQMVKEWIKDNYWTKKLHFNFSGNYLFKIKVFDTLFGCFANTATYQIHAHDINEPTYPLETKLTLWEPSGTILPTNLKIYVGESESFELYMPPIEKSLPWQAYAANSTTRFVHYHEEDNKILLSSIKNGIKAEIPPQAGLYPNTEHYESLVFDIRLREFKTSDNTVLIGLNYFEGDYALKIATQYIDTWVQYIIPIQNFNWHNYSAALAQICFYGSFRAEIKNLFVADYRNITTILQDASNKTINYESSNETYRSSLVSIDTTSKNPSITWSNSSFYCEESNFNISGFISENVTIGANETIKLNLTGNYLGEYSFTYDTIGGSPAEWSCSGATQVISGLGGHNKVLELIGTGSGDTATNSFTGIAEGTVELWIRTNDTEKATIFAIEDAALQHSIFFGIATGYFMFISNTYPTGYYLKTLVPNAWYKIRIIFNTTAESWDIWFGGTHYGPYDFYGTPTLMDGVQFMNWDETGGQATYLDAVDYSWASGYFLNRNWANTYFPNGTYLSKSYDLGIADFYFYQNLNFSENIASNTVLTLEYRSSIDNETWLYWSNTFTENTTIQEYKNHYFQFRVNLSTWGNYTYTPKCYWVNLTHENANSTFFVEDLLQPSFSQPQFLKNITLKVQVNSIGNLINSSINLWNFSSNTYKNISSIEQACVYNVTADFYNSTNYLKMNITIYSSENFTLSYNQAELWIYGYKFNKTCEIIANFSLPDIFNFSIFYYQFNPPQGLIKLLFYNTTNWTLHSLYPITQNLSLVTFWLNISSYTMLRFKFIYQDAHLNDLNVTANISRYFFSAEYSYRLLSEQNRQATDFIQFNAPLQTICLTDAYGNIIYKSLHNRTQEGYFIDIMLDYFEVSFSNFVPDTIVTFSIKDRGRTINITLPYGITCMVPLFTGDYIITLSDDINKTVITMWDVVISRVKNRLFSYNLSIPVVEHAPSWLDQYWPIFIPLGFLLVIIVVAGRRYYKKRKVKKAYLRKKQLEHNRRMKAKRAANRNPIIR